MPIKPAYKQFRFSCFDIYEPGTSIKILTRQPKAITHTISGSPRMSESSSRLWSYISAVIDVELCPRYSRTPFRLPVCRIFLVAKECLKQCADILRPNTASPFFLMGTSKNHLYKDADRRNLKHNRIFRAGAAASAACLSCPAPVYRGALVQLH